MIIHKNSENIKNDFDTLNNLAENFYNFQNHNQQLARDIWINLHLHEDKFYKRKSSITAISKKRVANSKTISEFFTPQKQIKIQNCNNWGEFIKFQDGEKEIKQVKSNACNSTLLCPFCASRKASKLQNRLEKFFNCFRSENELISIDEANSMESIINNEFTLTLNEHTLKQVNLIKKEYGNILDLNWYFSVLTVKNSHDINEVFTHLKQSFEKIRRKIKHFKERDIETFFDFLGAVYSIEITYNPKTGYHPHINILFCSKDKKEDIKEYKKRNGKTYFNSESLSKEWHEITKDSYITSCTPLDMNNEEQLKKNLMEVIKYSLKFNSIPNKNLIEIYPYLYKQRLFGTLGFFYGLGLDKMKIEKFTNSENRYFIDFVMYLDKNKVYNFKEKTKEKIIKVDGHEEIHETSSLHATNKNIENLINSDEQEKQDLEEYFDLKRKSEQNEADIKAEMFKDLNKWFKTVDENNKLKKLEKRKKDEQKKQQLELQFDKY